MIIYTFVSHHKFDKSSAVAEMGDRLATIDMGRKVGAAVPLFGEGAGSLSNTMWPEPRPTSVPSGILTHPAIWPQYQRHRQTGQRSEEFKDVLLHLAIVNDVFSIEFLISEPNFRDCGNGPF